MARTANIYTRVDPEIKDQAEAILNQLGIPMSNAIGMFLRQVVMHKGIPFDMKLPVEKPKALGAMTKEEFDAEMQKAIDSEGKGPSLSVDEMNAYMKRRYGI